VWDGVLENPVLKGVTVNVGIYIFDQVEVLDFAGPFEVFSTTARVKHRREPDAPNAFEVFTVSDVALVHTRANLLVQPHFSLTNHPKIDVLIVPGGVVTAELEKPDVTDWIKDVDSGTQLTASVCTGAFLLAQAGLLDGKRVTTHWEDCDDLERMFPNVRVERGVHWVDEGRIVTSAGISAGIDMSLHLVSRLLGLEIAEATAHQMEYAWHKRSEQ
jgi:transcriptional regulator GlxA family with amidase domain